MPGPLRSGSVHFETETQRGPAPRGGNWELRTETCRPGGEADAGLWAEEVDIQCHDKCDATDDVISPDQTQPHIVTTDRRCSVQPRRKGGNIKTDQSNIITKKQELQISRRKISQLIYLLVDFCSWLS